PASGSSARAPERPCGSRGPGSSTSTSTSTCTRGEVHPTYPHPVSPRTKHNQKKKTLFLPKERAEDLREDGRGARMRKRKRRKFKCCQSGRTSRPPARRTTWRTCP